MAHNFFNTDISDLHFCASVHAWHEAMSARIVALRALLVCGWILSSADAVRPSDRSSMPSATDAHTTRVNEPDRIVVGNRVIDASLAIPRGGGIKSWLLAGHNPFGYRITELGEQYLEYEGSLDSDVGRFLASLRNERKTHSTLKKQWLEILRITKTAQTMRIYRQFDQLIEFLLQCGFID